MGNEKSYFLSFLLFFATLTTSLAAAASSFGIKKSDFPSEFVFGAGTSAFQVEGAALEDGKKESIWMPFTHSGVTLDNRTGDIAADQYHKYKEDVKLMHDLGLDAYRFSISWPRLIPDGRGSVNPKGLEYYNNLIDELVSYGIQPHVTLYHFDLPLALQDEYEGLLSPRIIEDFTAYADVCFKEFGDRVKNWITVNEPNLESFGGYDSGTAPPRRCSWPFGTKGNCSKGDSTREPYIVAHRLLKLHLSASMLYKEKYKSIQGGIIGMTIAAYWFEPFTKSQEDVAARDRLMDFHIGWFMDPLVYGDYPAAMKERVGSRLPSFSFEDSSKLKYSSDFIGITHYKPVYVRNMPNSLGQNERDYVRDFAAYAPRFLDAGSTKVLASTSPYGLSNWWNNSINPEALEKVLDYFKVKYKNPPILLHENGFGEYGVDSSTNGTNDDGRVEYLQAYIKSTLNSVRNGSNVRGYFVWSFVDCFELTTGYTTRFGLFGVDFNRKDRPRYPKLSAYWYAEFLNSNRLNTHVSSGTQVM